MWIGWLQADLLLGAVGSLKEKRSVVRPIVAELARRFAVSAAEVDHLELHRRAAVGVSLVSADARHVGEVLDQIERHLASRPEVDLLSVQRRLRTSDDD